MIRAHERGGRATRCRVATLVASGVLTGHESGARRSVPGLNTDSAAPPGVLTHVGAFIKQIHTKEHVST